MENHRGTEAQSTSLQEVATSIFGEERPEAVRRWVEYWESSSERNRQLLEMFARLVPVDFRNKSILDIGCGTGGMGEVIGSDCGIYAGGDFKFHVLQFARPGPRRRYLQCSGTSLPFPDSTFDYIFALDVIEHLVGGLGPQLEFLRELRRVLRPLGMIFLSTPNRLYPYEAHSELYLHHYFPARASDRYIAWRNPAFLDEHGSFAEIPLLTPRALQRLLKKSGLAFLHDLPCGVDRGQYLRLFPSYGWLAYLGLGWYPHAEFWGVLVRQEARQRLRLKRKDTWFYEHNQPSSNDQQDFGSTIDFRIGPFGRQLGRGWHWHEPSNESHTGFRWTSDRAVCFLQSGEKARFIRVEGFSPRPNRISVRVDGLRVGERSLASGSFGVEYLLPFPQTADRIFQVEITAETFYADDPQDRRELGLMIFLVGLAA